MRSKQATRVEFVAEVKRSETEEGEISLTGSHLLQLLRDHGMKIPSDAEVSAYVVVPAYNTEEVLYLGDPGVDLVFQWKKTVRKESENG